ncbi:ribonuclease H [Podospora fimiseda]|uniref:Ribonuclease H n=1 Tax=Podospora fimiseda TaxID=252190 RepID=A0AAN7BTE5_9PEZI|nr:ribonuclease H [Podospora fimiseda]
MEQSSIVVLPPYYNDRAKPLRHHATIQPATIYTPEDPSMTPEQHFPLQTVGAGRGADRQFPRFINRFNSRNYPRRRFFLRLQGPSLCVSQTCRFIPVFLINGSSERRWRNRCFPLEQEGPNGDVVDHTSNKAKVVVLTDLEYIVHGATTWLPRWAKRRWKKRTGGAKSRSKIYANRDLWEALQSCIDKLRAEGCESFLFP